MVAKANPPITRVDPGVFTPNEDTCRICEEPLNKGAGEGNEEIYGHVWSHNENIPLAERVHAWHRECFRDWFRKTYEANYTAACVGCSKTLQHPSLNSDPSIRDFLITEEVDTTKDFMQAIARGDVEKAQHMLSNEEILRQISDEAKKKALRIAAIKGYIQILNILNELPCMTDEDRRYVFDEAVRYKSHDAVNALVTKLSCLTESQITSAFFNMTNEAGVPSGFMGLACINDQDKDRGFYFTARSGSVAGVRFFLDNVTATLDTNDALLCVIDSWFGMHKFAKEDPDKASGFLFRAGEYLEIMKILKDHPHVSDEAKQLAQHIIDDPEYKPMQLRVKEVANKIGNYCTEVITLAAIGSAVTYVAFSILGIDFPGID